MENWKKCLYVVQKANKVKKTLKSAGKSFEKVLSAVGRRFRFPSRRVCFSGQDSRHSSLQDIVVILKIFLLEITDDTTKGLFLQYHYTNPVQQSFPYIFGLRREWKLGT